MFKRILIANRSEIAVRIMQTAHRMGIETVAVYSDADANALHVSMADAAVHIGASPASDSYLCTDHIIDAAIRTGAQAIHPGYGFLSENPEFVDALDAAGLVFIGPSAAAIRAMGLKDAAKALMHKAGVPVVPGYHEADQDAKRLKTEAASIGYPVLIKARAGGGGKGMRLVEKPEQFNDALAGAVREAQASFGDGAVLIEKYITQPRHIEVQVFGDNHGNVVHVFERDCSLQRRHQKVVEEAPAPGMSDSVRQAMTQAAVMAAKTINYSGAGTVEFIVDASGPLREDGFWFMEMNTRLQVEHPVTEAITGVDLVEAQIRVANNEVLPFRQSDLSIKGHAMEVRVYAEDVAGGFMPAAGHLQHVEFDSNVRVDTGIRAGDSITAFYDPMIAKLTASAESRDAALAQLQRALGRTHIAGTVTNLAFLEALLQQPEFIAGKMDTGLIDRALPELVQVASPDLSSRLLASLLILQIDPTQRYSGWRLLGVASHLVSFYCKDEHLVYRLVLAGNAEMQLQTHYNDNTLCTITVENLNTNGVVYVENGHRQSASFHRWQDAKGNHLSLNCNGQCHTFTQDDPLNRRAADTTGDHALLAPITGVVRVLNAEVGQKVRAGDNLIVMEAMKMETTLTAVRDAVIDVVNCKVGENVEGGAVLVQFEEVES